LLLQSSKIDPDWIDSEEYYGSLIDRQAPAKYREKCRAVLQGLEGFGIAKQDMLMFHKFFKPLMEPGAYLQIGAGKDPVEGSSTFFFDVCLGWRGIVVEPDPVFKEKYASHRSARVITNCLSSRDSFVSFLGRFGSNMATGGSKQAEQCTTLERILTENPDILGLEDLFGKWGSNLNLVTIDMEGYDVTKFLSCTNLKGLLSTTAKIQVWTIRTSSLSAPQLRALDAAMLFAGFAKVTPNLNEDRSFFEDIYVLMPNAAGDTAYFLSQHRCKGGRNACALSQIMKPGRGGLPLKCD
jgi:hypothetical protein